MSEQRILLTDLLLGESPRWHEGRLWFADWGAREIIAVDEQGNSEVVTTVESFPFSIDWLPDGRLLIVSATQRRLLRREPDGSIATHANLAGISEKPWNEIVVDGRGNTYLNNIGFDFPDGEVGPGIIAMVTPDGRRWAGGRQAGVPQRHGRHGGQLHTDRRGVLRQAIDGLRHRRRRRPVASAGVGPTSRTVSRTAFAWMPRTRSGTPTCRTSGASASAKAGRSCRQSRSTVGVSPACWAAPMAARCTSRPRGGRSRVRRGRVWC